LTPAKHSKERGLTISLPKAAAYVGYTRSGLNMLFSNPNDIDHRKFNSLVDKAQRLWENDTKSS
jgi:hypothetical protein